MVLLDAIVNDRLGELAPGSHFSLSKSSIVVAHLDHGIRSDSSLDEEFVRGVVGDYGLRYEHHRAELGIDTSEDMARKVRYRFLRQCCKEYNAQLITAHHQDDVVETMLINLIRGTGWRGLAPMGQFSILNLQSSNNSQIPNNNQILRPLLGTPKAAILAYAEKHHLKWREDSTNSDTKYLRNYLRLKLIPNILENDPEALHRFLEIYQSTSKLKKEIATELQKVIIKYQVSNIEYALPRYDIVMLPSSVAREIIYSILSALDPSWHPRQSSISKVLNFSKAAFPDKTYQLSSAVEIISRSKSLQFKKIA